jgi:hypothetical protein
VHSERLWRAVWLLAAAHNILGGLVFLFLGDWLHAREGLAFPEPPIYLVTWALLVMVFGLMYYKVYQDLYNSRQLVLAGIAAKLLMATTHLYYLTLGGGVPRVFWVSVLTNYGFAALFIVFLRVARKNRQLIAAAQRA